MTTLAHYQIDAEIGRGGMGIVYKATDTKLDRTVALKVLPPHALASQDDRARFYREAKAAAQLHHPNIATIFEISEAVPSDAPHGTEPRPFIAMEFVDGDPVDARIKKGPLALEEAVRIASQVAEALEMAHEAGIVHRDIKSGNVMLAAKGTAKVLDFGLAKTADSTQLTRQGSTLGTMAYMSPEQARGEEVDGRTDLWALGVMLYEMIAGRLPFAADYEQAALYGILHEDPEPLTSIRTGVPMGLEWIVSKLMAKPVSDRYQTASDLLVDLRTVDLQSQGLSRVSTASRASMPAAPSTPASDTKKAIPPAAWAVFGALLVGAVWLLWPSSGTPESEITPKRLSQTIPVGESVIGVDLSPSGDAVAIAAGGVYVLDLTSGKTEYFPAVGTVVHTEFSPDGTELLLTGATGISRLSLQNGSVVDIVNPAEGGPRATWIDDQTIVFEERQSIFRASLTSSEMIRVTANDSLNGEYDHDWPSILPGGEILMATAEFRDEPSRIGFWDLESGENLGYLKIPGYRVQWLDPGYLVAEVEGNAVAVPFDLDRLEQTGPLVTIALGAGAQGLSVSNDGTMVHAGLDIGIRVNSAPVIPLILTDKGGSALTEPLSIPPARYRNMKISPDGSEAAVVVETEIENGEIATDIWLVNFATESRRQLTRGGNADFPAWTAAGDSLYFVLKDRNDSIMSIARSGRGGPETMMEGLVPNIVDLAVSGDARAFVAGYDGSFGIASAIVLGFGDLYGASAAGFTGDVVTPGENPRQLSFSPAARYLAYEENGGILVQELANLDSPPSVVWENGMSLPVWAPDGSMLYGIAADGQAHAIPIQLEPNFAVLGPPAVAFNWPVAGASLFDVFPDGERFLMPGRAGSEDEGAPALVDSSQTVDLHFVINLPAELR